MTQYNRIMKPQPNLLPHSITALALAIVLYALWVMTIATTTRSPLVVYPFPISAVLQGTTLIWAALILLYGVWCARHIRDKTNETEFGK